MHTSAPRLYNKKRSRRQRREALMARAAQPLHTAGVPCVECSVQTVACCVARAAHLVRRDHRPLGRARCRLCRWCAARGLIWRHLLPFRRT